MASRHLLITTCLFLTGITVEAHDTAGHSAPTYELSPSAEPAKEDRVIVLRVLDDESGEPLAARFSLVIDGIPFVPEFLSSAGMRFTSVHTAKKQRETILYCRGEEEPVHFSLPDQQGTISIHVARGYEFLPSKTDVEIPAPGETGEVEIRLRRWINLAEGGWHAADTHLHYERTGPDRDEDWATMLEADGLSQGFFMVLKGGNLPGIWAQQYAYGDAGTRAVGGNQLLVPGEEFRGSAQGHNNLFGMAKVIEPISVGGMGTPAHRPNWPSMHDALLETTRTGGIGGPAHGGTFGKASTVYVDALLGASEFVELANTHLYEWRPWYHLLNCGVILPPMAGTDLPNFPYRETWQPFFGETATYVKVDDPADFEAWKSGVRTGQVFITSGPLIRLETKRSDTGEITAVAELSSPLPLHSLEMIRNGAPIPDVQIEKTRDDTGVYRWTARTSFHPDTSCWIAARGEGAPKRHLWAESGINKNSIAHTAAVPFLVDDNPVRVRRDVEAVRTKLHEQRTWYEENGVFPDEETRKKMLQLFDRALEKLK